MSKENIFLYFKSDRISLILFLLVFLVTLLPRFFYIKAGLPHYSIDENDIVEFAIGYFGRDLDPHWYKYGPLYSYLLAIIFFIQSFFSSESLNEFVQGYFSDSFSFYFIARLVNSLVHIGLAYMAFLITFKFLSKKAAPFAFILGLIPFADNLTNYTIRVDSLLALNLSLSLYFILHLFRKISLKWILLSGFFVGFSFGTKPIPSLLVLPTIFLSLFLANLSHTKETLNFNIFTKTLVNLFLKPQLYFLGLSILFGIFISHPYSIINFSEFLQEQISVVGDDSGFGYTKGYVLSRFFGILGIPFILISVLATIFSIIFAFKKKKWIVLSLVVFILTYWGAFAGVPAREYFYVPLIPILCSLIAYFPYHYYNQFKFSKISFNSGRVILFLILAFTPFNGVVSKFKDFGLSNDKLYQTSSLLAEKWVKENIQVNTKILFYGYYVSLPRLVDPNPNEQAQYGEYFMYYRYKNEYLKQQFLKNHQDYIKSGQITYDLVYNVNIITGENENKSYYTRYEMGEDEQYLLSITRQMGIPYIITNYNLQKYPEFQNLLVWSSEEHDTIGGNVYIYKIL